MFGFRHFQPLPILFGIVQVPLNQESHDIDDMDS